MKLSILSAVHPDYPGYFYRKHPRLKRKSHLQQKRAFDYDAHSWADFWSHALKDYGYDVDECNVNIQPLQKAWALENNVPFKRERWIPEIALQRLKHFQPEVLFLADFSYFDLAWLSEVKQQCPKLRLTLAWYGSYCPDPAILRNADAVVSCIPDLVDQCNADGLKAFQLHHAFEPRILERLSARRAEAIPFSFVGQLATGKGLHNQRVKLMNAIAKQCEISLYTPGKSGLEKFKSHGRHYVYNFAQNLKEGGVAKTALKELPVVRKAADWKEEPDPTRALKPFMRPPVFGIEMFRTLQDSFLTFNQHIDISANSASNMRLFEATGVRTCLITDAKENLHQLFAPEKEVITYRNAEECVEKVRWYFDHPAEREKIAKAGQLRTLQEHTFSHRAAELDQIIRKSLG